MGISSSLDGASISPEVRSFFRAIKENPDDDTPRLIFADWLQERGDAAAAARGEYLRLSVLRHRLSPDDPNYSLLKRREGELFTEHRWVWLGPLQDAARTWSFERGMIQITAEARNLSTPEVTAWTQTEAALWIDALTLSTLKGADIFSLADSPLLANVNQLDLHGNGRFRLQLLFRALGDREFRFLTHLRLIQCRLSLETIESLARCKLPRLSCLDYGRCIIPDEGIALLRQTFGERVQL